MKPRIMASRPEISMTTSRMMSSNVIGIGASSAFRLRAAAHGRQRGAANSALRRERLRDRAALWALSA